MKNNLFMISIVVFTFVLLASCNGGGSSVNPTPSPSASAKYAYVANSNYVGSTLYLCDINSSNGLLQNCESVLSDSQSYVRSMSSDNGALYMSYHVYSGNFDGVSSYTIGSNGVIDQSSLVNNSTINTFYPYQHEVSTYNNMIYIVNGSGTGNYAISNCSLDAPNWLKISTCSNFDSSAINLAGLISVGKVVFNQNGYAYFITSNYGYQKQYNEVAQCQVSARNSGALINCTANNSFNSTNYLTSMAVTDSYAYIFNSDEKSINVCPITANGTLGTCQKQQPVNSAGQNMMGATAISPIVRNNRLFFVNSAQDAATSSAVVSCPISATGLLGACTTSATSAQFASPQAMTMM